MKLYEIMQELELALTPDENGEITQEQLDAFEQLELAKNEKIENIACWIKNLRADADAIWAEVKVLVERRKVKENQANYLQSLLSNFLKGEQFESARCRIGYRKSEQIEITNEKLLPKEFWVVKKDVSKTLIRDAILAGQKVKGASLVEKQNIQIK
jgi:hypothetical protein